MLRQELEKIEFNPEEKENIENFLRKYFDDVGWIHEIPSSG